MQVDSTGNIVSLPFVAATRAASAPALGRFGTAVRRFGGRCRTSTAASTRSRARPRRCSSPANRAAARNSSRARSTTAASRGRAPFVAVNCGAIPANLIEAELFGYEKGAFTGAARMHRGCFERAEGGTLFLDEVTEMAPEMQVRLLRVLETGRFTRVGGEEELRARARIVAATNRDPRQAVHDGQLREDLMYRLAVFPIALPPLRERDGDAELLAEHFLRQLNDAEGTAKAFSRQAIATIRAHRWPGNVRELKNAVQRAFILADDDVELDFAGLELRGADGQFPACRGRNAARGNRAAGDLRDARPVRRQQAAVRRDAGREPQDALQPASRVPFRRVRRRHG